MRTCPACETTHDRNHAYCAECHAAYMRTWRLSHPLEGEARRKANARAYAGVYLRRGLIERGDCVDCGASTTDERIEMHHADYSKPLEVTWLCRPCHLLRHRACSTPAAPPTI